MGMREARKHDTVRQPHASLVFPPSHPSMISQYRVLATVMDVSLYTLKSVDQSGPEAAD